MRTKNKMRLRLKMSLGWKEMKEKWDSFPLTKTKKISLIFQQIISSNLIQSTISFKMKNEINFEWRRDEK